MGRKKFKAHLEPDPFKLNFNRPKRHLVVKQSLLEIYTASSIKLRRTKLTILTKEYAGLLLVSVGLHAKITGPNKWSGKLYFVLK